MFRPLLLALLLLAGLPAAARAWTWGDTLTVIMKPLPNLPAFARPLDTLTVWANAPVSATNFAASLLLGTDGRALTPAGGGWDASRLRWVLYYRVPAGMPDLKPTWHRGAGPFGGGLCE